jgi:hypothetical protein
VKYAYTGYFGRNVPFCMSEPTIQQKRNGEDYATMSTNTTKEITVESGATLRAEYTNYAIYPYSGINQSRQTTASDGMNWSIP